MTLFILGYVGACILIVASVWIISADRHAPQKPRPITETDVAAIVAKMQREAGK